MALQAIGAMDDCTSSRLAKHLTCEKKQCADPRKGDFPEFEPVCTDIRLSVKSMKQEALIGRKDPRSRALTSQEHIQFCEVMLALVDPSCYPGEKHSQRKMSENAAEMV
eukprot:308385-Amphidinium_carterae.4